MPSLVGSEMCIRDSPNTPLDPGLPPGAPGLPPAKSGPAGQRVRYFDAICDLSSTFARSTALDGGPGTPKREILGSNPGPKPAIAHL